MKFETEFGGKKLIVETQELANQANGSCLVSYGETTVLTTIVISKEEKEVNFLPLSIEYEERFYAAGKIKGSRFIKRETRPPDEAILACRLIDRALRPLFNQNLRREIQVINTVLSTDQENDPDLVALYGSILSTIISDIPWDGPIAGIRIGQINGEWVVNPTYLARKKSDFDLVLAGRKNQILMIEAAANEVNKETISEACKFAEKHLEKLVKFFEEVQDKSGKKKNVDLLEGTEIEPEIISEAKNFLKTNFNNYFLKKPLKTKEERGLAIFNLKNDFEKTLIKKSVAKESRKKILEHLDKFICHKISQGILTGQRIDGRVLDEIRSIEALVGCIFRTHGSAIFSRGETQVLSTVTLGAPSMEQYLDTMEETGRKRFMHHYNFPPFCSGEVKPLRTTGRRETGHGVLVEKAFLPILPDQESFPYTIRLVSEVLSSNGSTSMAAACACSLALMDAGVPIKKPLAGVAIGLASEQKDGKIQKYQLITDLQDLEDGPDGMDFKVIGTTDGICAIQMDTKTKGLNLEIIQEALDKAKIGREKILKKMAEVLAEPRANVSAYAPKISAFRIDPLKIREVIGPGGRIINEIIAQTGTTIDIEQDGLVVVTSVSEESVKKAVDWIKNLTREMKVGEVFQGKISRIVNFGVFVEIIPGHEGLVHISELAPHRIEHPSEVVQVGDIIPVKIIEIDQQGRINLSTRAATDPNYIPQRRERARPRTFRRI